MLTHVGKILIEILDPVAVRVVSRLCQPMSIDSLPLFYVPLLHGREMLVRSRLCFLAQFVIILDIIHIRVYGDLRTSTYIQDISCVDKLRSYIRRKKTKKPFCIKQTAVDNFRSTC